MPVELVSGILRDFLVLAATTGGPLLGALLIVGLLFGILQSATQIQDPAVSFLPRLATVGLLLWFFGRWMAERFAAAFAQAIARMGAPF
ncbi:MAG TPA: flagellar biosynthetic protein FliQ [Vulgatibacter sp.]|nr:flagellar biosynthetic protein FliQ [Vulgatibacter sp.]